MTLVSIAIALCYVSCCRTAPADKALHGAGGGGGTVSGAINTRFNRNVQGRSTVHGGPIRDRRATGGGHAHGAYNGPGGLPMHSQDTSAMGANRLSFLTKLTSKFSRRYVDLPP